MNELSNILTELIFILLHLFVFLANYLLANKNLFYPSVLFSLSWTVILTLHFIFGFTILDQLYPLGIDTFFIVFIGTLSFSFGCFMMSLYRQHRRFERPIHLQFEPPIFRISLRLRMIFLAILVIGLPFYIQASYRVFLASHIDDFFVGLRTELSYGDEDIGVTKYLVTFSFVIFSINYYTYLKQKSNLNLLIVIFTFIVTVTYSILATGRSYFFMILSIYLGLSYLIKKGFSLKKYITPVLIFSLLFISIGILYGKGGSRDDSLKENLKSSSETTAIYLVSSLSALDMERKNHVRAKYGGENTLLFFVKIGQKLDLLSNVKAGTLLSEFVFVPYPTNVFTFYSPYIRDYGVLYAWIMIAFFGASHTWIFHKAVNTKNIRYSLYYSFLLYPALMSFFQDQYMSLFSTWLQIIFYTEAFLAINSYFNWRFPGKIVT
ncbi:MAG: O-antigen polymerase [Ginsengibacter sp.]